MLDLFFSATSEFSLEALWEKQDITVGESQYSLHVAAWGFVQETEKLAYFLGQLVWEQSSRTWSDTDEINKQ